MKAGSLIRFVWPGTRRDPPGAAGPACRRWVALVLLLVHVGGCYRYVPTSTSQTRPSAAVSIRINDHGRIGLASSIGPGVTRITGAFRANSDTALLIDMRTVEINGLNMPMQMSGTTVEIPRSYVEEIRERRFSRSRTVAAGVLVGIGLVASMFAAVSGFGGEGPIDRPDPGGGGETR